MPVVLYLDKRSQPCRALMMLVNLAKLKVEICEVSIMAGDQYSPEFKAINPN